jgi:hypothetical protein
VSELVQITDYNSRVLSLIIEQFKEKETVKGIPRAMNIQANDLEEALFEIRDNYWITTAVGVQLDVIGHILNIPRDGRADEEYRTFLLSRVGASFSGTPEEIIATLIFAYEYSTPVIYFTEGYNNPAHYYIIDNDGNDLSNSILEPLSPAGVLGLFVVPILYGDTTLPEPWLLDANGNQIYCAYNTSVDDLITGAGDTLIYDDGDTIGVVSPP